MRSPLRGGRGRTRIRLSAGPLVRRSALRREKKKNMSHDLSKLAWKAQRPGGEAALRALQAGLKREYGAELAGAIAKAKRRERKTGREQTVTFAPTMERAYHKYANKPETIAWYRKQLWPFSVSARPDQSRATAPVIWSTGHHYDVHDWARRKRQRWAGEAERRAARAMHDPAARDPRSLPRGPRRGAGARTIYWHDSDDGKLHLYVRGPGAAEWAKSKGEILGDSWDVDRRNGDFAHAMADRYAGWQKDVRKEGYRTVKFKHLEYPPPRSWITSRDRARAPKKRSSPKRRRKVRSVIAKRRKVRG